MIGVIGYVALIFAVATALAFYSSRKRGTPAQEFERLRKEGRATFITPLEREFMHEVKKLGLSDTEGLNVARIAQEVGMNLEEMNQQDVLSLYAVYQLRKGIGEAVS